MKLFPQLSVLVTIISVSVVLAEDHFTGLKYSTESYPKRQYLLGSYQNISVTDEYMQKALKGVFGQLKLKIEKEVSENNLFLKKVSKVNWARRQVVNGINYKLSLTLERQNSSQPLLCEAVIYASRYKEYEISKLDCN